MRSCVHILVNGRPLLLELGQPGSSAFTRVDMSQSRPVAVDPALQYADYTSASSASTDFLRLTTNVSAPTQIAASSEAPFQPPLTY